MKILLLLVFLLLASCSSEKSDNIEKPVHDKTIDSPNVVQIIDKYALVRDKYLINEDDIKWRIFEKNIGDTLRLLRNKIYAKYGYKFKSLDLQKYFNSKSWYKINPEYNHSILTHDDSFSVQTLIKYENFLGELSTDSIKILKNIFDFRNELYTKGYDSTITVKKDITGDGNSDSFISKVKFEDSQFSIENILKSNNKVLWSEKSYLSSCVQYIDDDDKILQNYPVYGYYYIIFNKFFSSLIPGVHTIYDLYGRDNYVDIKITGTDTIYEAGSILFNCEDESEWFKKYLFNFKGNQVTFSYGYCLYAPGEGYDVKIWNSLTKEFVLLWSGP